MPDLETLGWDGEWAAAFAAQAAEGLVPGRVAVQHRGAYDVLTADSPLLGPWSSGSSAIVGLPTFHPGPLLFWLLAIPARMPWPEAMELTIGLVNLACVPCVLGLVPETRGTDLASITAPS